MRESMKRVVRDGIQQENCTGIIACCQGTTICIKDNVFQMLFVAKMRNGLLCHSIPQENRAIKPPGCQEAFIRAEGQALDRERIISIRIVFLDDWARCRIQYSERVSRCCILQDNLTLVIPCRDQLAIRAENGAEHAICIAELLPERSPCRHFPQENCTTTITGCESLTIWTEGKTGDTLAMTLERCVCRKSRGDIPQLYGVVYTS